MFGVPLMEGPVEKCIDDVVPMVLRDGNVGITGMPPIPFMDWIDGLATLEKIIGLDMV
jgi:hypothetical protein